MNQLTFKLLRKPNPFCFFPFRLQKLLIEQISPLQSLIWFTGVFFCFNIPLEYFTTQPEPKILPYSRSPALMSRFAKSKLFILRVSY